MQENNKNVQHAHAGHRSRLRDRFAKFGSEAFQDYELLEMILGYARPLVDTKPTAKLLLETFSDLRGIIGAEISHIKAVPGIGETSVILIKLIHEVSCRMLRSNAMDKPILDGPEAVVNYCKAKIGYFAREINLILFLNSKNHLLKTEMRFEGTIDHSHTYPREIIAKALEVGAKSIILVHNHPSGDSTPSKEDFTVTEQIQEIASLMQINLQDHIIVGRHFCYSMRLDKKFY